MYKLHYEPYEAWATVPSALAPHECEVIRKLFTDTKAGYVGNNVTDKTIRDSRIQWMYYGPQHHWLFEKLARIINEVNKSWFGMELTHTEEIQLTEYDSEYQGFYGQHVDAVYGPGASRSRKMSITIQLTDPAEYEGGELRLYPNNFKDHVSASKDIGAMTIFRSHIIHEVMPVTKGNRMSLVTWVHGPLFT